MIIECLLNPGHLNSMENRVTCSSRKNNPEKKVYYLFQFTTMSEKLK
jgi:hypothetical protein